VVSRSAMESWESSKGQHTDDAGQRRHVTLLFSDLCDYTQLSEQVDPEDIDLLRRQIERRATDVIHKHGGSVSQYYGDGILAVFGLPSAAEHEVRAAVNAAIELRVLTHELEAAIELPPGFVLGMHFGVHCGLVFARMGDPLHGRYELTGDAVNTAARLCAAAERNEILVSETAMRGIEPFFESDVVQELILKGKRLSVPAYRVHAPSDVRTRFEASARRGLTTLVGRDDALAQLKAAVDAALQGRPRVLGLCGGPGIGKTRVLEELAQQIAGTEVQLYRGTCESYGDVVPLQPLLQILRQVFALATDLPPSAASAALAQRCHELGPGLAPHAGLFASLLAPETFEPSLPVHTFQRQLVEAIGALIGSLPARLCVLAIDDWQWVDDLSHQVLRGLFRLFDRGLLIVLAAREHKPHDVLLEGAERIELRPLATTDAVRMIRSLLPNALDLGLTDGLCRRAGGNPLFLEELCRSLRQDLPCDALALERTAVPHTIHGVIQTRLQALPAQEFELLRVASVIGNEFTNGLLAEVADCGEVAPLLARLAAADLVREGDERGSQRFKHGITREVVYESIRRSERRAIHASIAVCLERRAAEGGAAPSHEALGHHHLRSGNHQRAAHHAELAGDKAALTSALDRARWQYGSALSELDKLTQDDAVKRRWLAVSVKWARAWVYSQAPEQLVLLDRAKRHAEELGDFAALADVEQMGAWICYALGEQARAIGHCQRGLALAERIGNPKLIAQLTSNLGQSHAAAGEYDQAEPLLVHAMQLKQGGASKRERAVPVGFAFALGALASIHADRGEFAAARDEMTRALAALSGSGHAIEASVLALAATNELWQGQWQRCIETCEHATATAERVMGPYVFSISEAMSSFSRFMLRPNPQDRLRLCGAAEWLAARGMGLYLSMVQGCAAEACWLAGDFEAAQLWAARAIERAARRDPFGQVVGLRVLAELQARRDRGSELSALLERADAAARWRGSRRERALNRFWSARIERAQQSDDAGRRELELVRSEFDAMDMSHHRAEVDACLAGSAPSG
jgi:class 3 adenylate cyclase/tetratricopeptide (TPR) repeat protein